MTDHGGKGANQAVACAKLLPGEEKGRVVFVGRVGGDAFGEGTRRNFEKVGVDTGFLKTLEGEESGVALILVEEKSGKNHITVVPGANHLFGSPEVEEAREVVQGSSVVGCQLEIKQECNLAAFKMAKEKDERGQVVTVLNPAPAAEIDDEVLGLTDYLIPNETETELLTGLKIGTDEELKEAAKKLLERGVRKAVIVTLGERGAFVMTRDNSEEPVLIPAPKVEAVDSSGAGDSFVGALAYLLAEGVELRKAVERAVKVASVSVTRRGTQKSYPSRDEVVNVLTS